MLKPTAACVFAVLILCGTTECEAVTFDWLTVGDPDNPSDAGNLHPTLQFGAVANIYRISKYEVTNDQYRDFLNSVDPTETNTNSIFSRLVATCFVPIPTLNYTIGDPIARPPNTELDLLSSRRPYPA